MFRRFIKEDILTITVFTMTGITVGLNVGAVGHFVLSRHCNNVSAKPIIGYTVLGGFCGLAASFPVLTHPVIPMAMLSVISVDYTFSKLN